MGWAYKLSPEAEKLDLETVLGTLAKHRMDFNAAARELKVKTIDELLSIALPASHDEVKQDAEVREQVLQSVPVG